MCLKIYSCKVTRKLQSSPQFVISNFQPKCIWLRRHIWLEFTVLIEHGHWKLGVYDVSNMRHEAIISRETLIDNKRRWTQWMKWQFKCEMVGVDFLLLRVFENFRRDPGIVTCFSFEIIATPKTDDRPIIKKSKAQQVKNKPVNKRGLCGLRLR